MIEKVTQEHKDFINELVLLKNKALQLGFYRTHRLLGIPEQEIGWEIQGILTPDYGTKRQNEILNIN